MLIMISFSHRPHRYFHHQEDLDTAQDQLDLGEREKKKADEPVTTITMMKTMKMATIVDISLNRHWE